MQRQHWLSLKLIIALAALLMFISLGGWTGFAFMYVFVIAAAALVTRLEAIARKGI